MPVGRNDSMNHACEVAVRGMSGRPGVIFACGAYFANDSVRDAGERPHLLYVVIEQRKPL
jgi:hypothetical protein